MKTYSDYALNNLNKHSLIKIIKDLYAIRDGAIKFSENLLKELEKGTKLDEIAIIVTFRDILQGNKEK